MATGERRMVGPKSRPDGPSDGDDVRDGWRQDGRSQRGPGTDAERLRVVPPVPEGAIEGGRRPATRDVAANVEHAWQQAAAALREGSQPDEESRQLWAKTSNRAGRGRIRVAQRPDGAQSSATAQARWRAGTEELVSQLAAEAGTRADLAIESVRVTAREEASDLLADATRMAEEIGERARAERTRLLQDALHAAELQIGRERRASEAELRLLRADASEQAARVLREAAAAADAVVSAAKREAEAMLDQGRREMSELWDGLHARRAQAEADARQILDEALARATRLRAAPEPIGDASGTAARPALSDARRPPVEERGTRIADDATRDVWSVVDD